MPKRVQRKRTKGYRLPEGAVYVGRPSRWGNPFEARYFGDRVLVLYQNAVLSSWNGGVFTNDDPDWLVQQAYGSHNGFRLRIGTFPIDAARYELRGRDLACWCPLDQPCHADVLLELANR